MLSGIVQYENQGYYDTYPTIRLYTPGGSHTVELFAGYATPPTNHALSSDSPWALGWEETAGFEAWLEQAQARSVFDSEVMVTPGDRVLTLSTCTNGGKDRFVLHGKLIADS